MTHAQDNATPAAVSPVATELVDAVSDIVNGLDGTFGTTVEDLAAKLGEQEHPEPVSGSDLARLLRAAHAAGLVAWAQPSD